MRREEIVKLNHGQQRKQYVRRLGGCDPPRPPTYSGRHRCCAGLRGYGTVGLCTMYAAAGHTYILTVVTRRMWR
jgi:hypothetical protein